MFCSDIDLEQIAQLAIDHAHAVCLDTNGECPGVDFEENKKGTLKLFNVPAHVEYVFFEILKNAMGATIMNQGSSNIKMRWFEENGVRSQILNQ